MNLKSDVIVFTDGSSRGNPGPGGFGAVIVADGKVTEVGGREERTTNNRMELQAAISALLRIKDKGLRIIIYSDSSYLVNGITTWVFGWQKNGWKTKAKQDVENRDLWEQLVMLITIYRNCDWKLVEGHAGVAGNQRCDEIATAFADGNTPCLYAGVLENYSIKNILDIAVRARHPNNFSKRKLERAKAYSYVSLVSGVVQTHKTWGECEARVKGKQAKYKKALSVDDERALIAEWSRVPQK